jgi:hypothetical protein
MALGWIFLTQCLLFEHISGRAIYISSDHESFGGGMKLVW